MEKGFIHVYTGNGKGKTTAAFGLVVRALCAGKHVFVGQFIKDMKYSETRLIQKFDNLEIKQLGCGCFFDRKPSEEDKIAAKEGLLLCSERMQSDLFDVIVLDELTIALYFNLLSIQDVLTVLAHKNPKCEVVITGRYAPKELIDVADLVTEMKEIKHYYKQGILSREGIDR